VSRVLLDVPADSLQFSLIPDNALVVVALPGEALPASLADTPAAGRFEGPHYLAERRRVSCRGAIHRALFPHHTQRLQPDNEVDVIGHDDEGIQFDGGEAEEQIQPFFCDDLAKRAVSNQQTWSWVTMVMK
jgi:hypothetical protein